MKQSVRISTKGALNHDSHLTSRIYAQRIFGRSMLHGKGFNPGLYEGVVGASINHSIYGLLFEKRKGAGPNIGQGPFPLT
jgi:hypothetical protein